MNRLLILGGSDAGISAALRAKEVDATSEVTIVLADRFPNYSICGLPFYLSGEVPDWHWLAHRTAEEITGFGVRLLLEHTAQTIDPLNHVVTVVERDGEAEQLRYDRLVIATGAVPVRPPIRGLDLAEVYVLHSMDDSFAVHAYLEAQTPRSAVIIGGGYIGLEMAEALTHRGLSVSVVEHGASVLKNFDTNLGHQVGAELRRHGVEVSSHVEIEEIVQEGGQLRVRGSEGFSTSTDLVLVGVGVQPVTDLAQSAGVTLGVRNAIRVSRAMETDVPDIYAAGDCVETWHRLLERPAYLPLGTTAHKQGRIAGENAVDGHQEFVGTLGIQAVKVFDMVVARTGLRDEEARRAGFDPLTVELTTWDHKVYYPGAHEMRLRLTGDQQTGRLLGAQIAGDFHDEVAKRVDIFATALFHGMRIDDLNALDLSYTPPVSSPWDPVQMSAQTWVAHHQRSLYP
jgi:NADPH-dependent 2,4-dienoyl-CoA reductase/sulfur reductase-like enzyme